MCMLGLMSGTAGVRTDSPLGRCEEMATAITHRGVSLPSRHADNNLLAQ
jgi:hypothetical protein